MVEEIGVQTARTERMSLNDYGQIQKGNPDVTREENLKAASSATILDACVPESAFR